MGSRINAPVREQAYSRSWYDPRSALETTVVLSVPELALRQENAGFSDDPILKRGIAYLSRREHRSPFFVEANTRLYRRVGQDSGDNLCRFYGVLLNCEKGGSSVISWPNRKRTITSASRARPVAGVMRVRSRRIVEVESRVQTSWLPQGGTALRSQRRSRQASMTRLASTRLARLPGLVCSDRPACRGSWWAYARDLPLQMR